MYLSCMFRACSLVSTCRLCTGPVAWSQLYLVCILRACSLVSVPIVYVWSLVSVSGVYVPGLESGLSNCRVCIGRLVWSLYLSCWSRAWSLVSVLVVYLACMSWACSLVSVPGVYVWSLVSVPVVYVPGR
jgi:hypothetical protein